MQEGARRLRQEEQKEMKREEAETRKPTRQVVVGNDQEKTHPKVQATMEKKSKKKKTKKTVPCLPTQRVKGRVLLPGSQCKFPRPQSDEVGLQILWQNCSNTT